MPAFVVLLVSTSHLCWYECIYNVVWSFFRFWWGGCGPPVLCAGDGGGDGGSAGAPGYVGLAESRLLLGFTSEL